MFMFYQQFIFGRITMSGHFPAAIISYGLFWLLGLTYNYFGVNYMPQTVEETETLYFKKSVISSGSFSERSPVRRLILDLFRATAPSR